MTTQSIFAGDDERLEFGITDADGNALDLTDMNILWALADGATADPTLTKDSANTGEIDVGSAVDGRFDVILNPSDTDGLAGASYHHEVELTDVDGNEFTVFQDGLYVQHTVV